MTYESWWDHDLDRPVERYKCDAPGCENTWEGRSRWGYPDGWHETLWGFRQSAYACSPECLKKLAINSMPNKEEV